MAGTFLGLRKTLSEYMTLTLQNGGHFKRKKGHICTFLSKSQATVQITTKLGTWYYCAQGKSHILLFSVKKAKLTGFRRKNPYYRSVCTCIHTHVHTHITMRPAMICCWQSQAGIWFLPDFRFFERPGMHPVNYVNPRRKNLGGGPKT